MGVFRFLTELWHSHRRQRDLELLWPVCRENTRNLEQAKRAFAFHTAHDPAWTGLSPDHIQQVIDALD